MPADRQVARDVNTQGARDDLLAGAIFLAFGGAFAYIASTYEVGSLLSMGPGYFPLVLGLVLAGLGLVIMATGLLRVRRAGVGTELPSPAPPRGITDTHPDAHPVARAGTSADVGVANVGAGTEPSAESDERGSVPWARGGLVLLAIVFFGLTVDGLGLGVALLVTVFLAAMAGPGTSWRAASVIALGLTALSIVLFVLLLQLRLPLVGPWLGG